MNEEGHTAMGSYVSFLSSIIRQSEDQQREAMGGKSETTVSVEASWHWSVMQMLQNNLAEMMLRTLRYHGSTWGLPQDTLTSTSSPGSQLPQLQEVPALSTGMMFNSFWALGCSPGTEDFLTRGRAAERVGNGLV